MSDESVHAALRSEHQLVLIEAPAGCGKTHQGAEYARDLALVNERSRPLILTHTHAACSVFAERTAGMHGRVDIRTIDSVVAQIAAAYHQTLGIPGDPAVWVRQHGYSQLALKVARLLEKHPMIASAVAHRHRVIICDEHQDSSGDQHALVMAFLNQGARVRMFADPMQKIFGDNVVAGSFPPWVWSKLKESAHACEELDFPHRWKSGCQDLGQWTLKARESLKAGGQIDLTSGVPESVQIVKADNQAKKNLEYQPANKHRKPIDEFVKADASLLILTHHNVTARGFRGAFARQFPLWEGHTRNSLEKLAEQMKAKSGDATAIASAAVAFLEETCKGLSASAFGGLFTEEVQNGCTKPRTKKPAKIQALARLILDDPTHRGVSRMLKRLAELNAHDADFLDVALDHYREFHDAVRLGEYETPDMGLAEITHRRTYSRPKPPAKAISTIHKAKGLECDAVLLMPCDAKTFPDKHEIRCLLYVALSRAKKRLMLVLPSAGPSPLFKV
jgi:superfamily I DNA/RNA helicase